MERVGRYRLVRRIGAGGMAEVFEAYAEGEAGFKRRVALKRILAAHRSDEAFVRMFLDEARLMGRLHHANIVSILDFGLVDGQPFQVLEFVDGTDAHHLHRDAPGGVLPPAIALAIALGVAHGLAHAHDARDEDGKPLGVVHRDVTPSNVLLSWDGDVKLSDFGIAFALDRNERTSTGIVKGKAAYMAPEQLFGGDLEASTDVFALGCVLHSLLCGRSPLAGAGNVERLLKSGAMPIDDAIDEDIGAIIARATHRDREARYRSASEMEGELAAALARRQSGDPRAALRAFLSARRSIAPERGKLDGLLRLELVLGETSGALRSFTTKEVAPPVQPKRSYAWLAIVPVAIAAIGGALWWSNTDVPVPSPDAAVPDAAIETPDAEIAPEDAATVVVVPDAEPVERPRRLRSLEASSSIPDRDSRTPERPTEGTELENSNSVGALAIGGEGARRAEIFVDGRSFGFAPRRIELPFGTHEVQLRRDEQVIATRPVHIDGSNTRSAPARLIVE